MGVTSKNQILQLSHNSILWYLREQGKQLENPYGNFLNVLNTDELVAKYIDEEGLIEDNPLLTRDIAMDIVPDAVFRIISNKDPETQKYLRSKSDIFVAQVFLQATPDVQKACKKLFGQDIIYLDSNTMIKCLIQRYSIERTNHLSRIFSAAKGLGIKIKTYRPFVQEIVAHLKGPVLLEWLNHVQNLDADHLSNRLLVAPALIGIFHEYSKQNGGSVQQVITEILGSTNHEENLIEFLDNEFGVKTEDIPEISSTFEQEEWERTFGIWLNAKRRSLEMSEDKFERLVRNDVNAYSRIRARRREKPQGSNYGHKVWILTHDRMYWRMPRLLDKENDHSYHVAMGIGYLLNFVATLENQRPGSRDEVALPATLILDRSDFIPRDLRASVIAELEDTDKPAYLKERRIRELVHEAKTSDWEIHPPEDIEPD